MPASICLVSTGNLASNPRLIKEADALHGAGYRVTVIACDYTASFREFDDEIERAVPWKTVRVQRPPAERLSGLAARMAGRLIDALGIDVPVEVAARAYGGPMSSLRAAAVAEPADLYIAHYVPALPAAAAAAGRHGALLGYDAEDFHSGEGQGGPAEDFRMEMVQRIEETFLPSCRHLTAASPLIAREYAARYGVVEPVSVLNVFPLAMAPATAQPATAPDGTLRAYWFSQTIGLDRGLQPFIHAMARAEARVTLDVRGSNRWGHGDALLALARDLGVADRVRILGMEAPGEMVRLAAHYDLGLSLEAGVTQSRRLCLTNKIFTYLLAGVPVMMSDTPAQLDLGAQLAAAGSMVSLADPLAIATSLDRLARPEALAQAKQKAWRLGRERYNWEYERQFLLQSVARSLVGRGKAA